MTSPRSETTDASPEGTELRRVQAFDLYDDADDSSDECSSQMEVTVSDSGNYLTPTNNIPYHFEFPPILLQNKTDSKYYFDLGTVGSDLYLPHPLLSCEGTEETESTVLLPSFVKLGKQNIDTELLSMPSFEDAGPEARDEGDEERMLEEEECSTFPFLENHPEGLVAGEDGGSLESRTTELRNSIDSLPVNKRPPSSTQPLNTETNRRNSLGAFAA